MKATYRSLPVVAVAGLLLAPSCQSGSSDSDAVGTTAEAVSLGGSWPGFGNEIGHVVSRGNGLARSFQTYDALGRQTASMHVLDGNSYLFGTTYGFPCANDACNNGTTTASNGPVVVASTFPDNELVTYTFDEGNAAQATKTTPSTGTTQTIVSKIVRNARGQTIEVDFGDTTTTTDAYNDSTDLRLNQTKTTQGSTLLQQYGYLFDGNGNVTTVNDYCDESQIQSCSSSSQNSTYSATFVHDTLGQLTQAAYAAGPAYTYGYDAVGNLTLKEGVPQGYPAPGAPRPHAIQSAGSMTYAYDANGNMTSSSNGVVMKWNAENMPVSEGVGSATTTKWFVGESLWKKTWGSWINYYLPSMRVENTKYRKRYGVFAERFPWDTTHCTVDASSGCLRFFHSDHLGSSTLVTDDAGHVVHRQAYKPFGEDIVANPPGNPPFTPVEQFNFKTKEQDGTGFYDYGARMYNPATGRWLSPDISAKDGVNRYTYVKNDPLRNIDPTGHDSETFTVDQDGRVHDTTTIAVRATPLPSPKSSPAPKVQDSTMISPTSACYVNRSAEMLRRAKRGDLSWMNTKVDLSLQPTDTISQRSAEAEHPDRTLRHQAEIINLIRSNDDDINPDQSIRWTHPEYPPSAFYLANELRGGEGSETGKAREVDHPFHESSPVDRQVPEVYFKDLNKEPVWIPPTVR